MANTVVSDMTSYKGFGFASMSCSEVNSRCTGSVFCRISVFPAVDT